VPRPALRGELAAILRYLAPAPASSGTATKEPGRG